MNNYAEDIKARVSLADLLAYYGFHPMQDRIPCPFHAGKDRNMLVSNGIYKCFVCGEHGDAITFVRRYFGLDFPSALAKINDDFQLGLPIGTRLSREDQAEADRRIAETRRKAEDRKRRREALENRYNSALDEFTACDTIMRRCAPISASTGLTDAFCWAAKNIDRAWAEVKEAEAELFRFRQEIERETA